MKIFDELNNKNFRLFAANKYNNPECTDVEEFKQDVNRFKYLKRLLTRYDEHGELQERLILNHLIVLHNVFGIEACHRMIMYKIHEHHHHIIKPFLVYLHYLPEDNMVEIPMDPTIVEVLRKL
tara:strand:+ start:776 stop:1144 length:369 start_codon:yes stop_codon:yes gene_type:complete